MVVGAADDDDDVGPGGEGDDFDKGTSGYKATTLPRALEQTLWFTMTKWHYFLAGHQLINIAVFLDLLLEPCQSK